MNLKTVAAGLLALWLAPAAALWPGAQEITATGPEIKVVVHVDPFNIEVQGNAELTRLDDHRIRMTAASGNITIALAPDEAIFGLTERIVEDQQDSESEPQAVGELNLRGQTVTMWVRPTMSAYTPFYISSAGYGMLVEGTRPGIYDIGNSSPDELRLQWDIGDQPFSALFIAGPDYLTVLDRYTETTGRPILPPRWVFRPWKWRDECPKFLFGTLDGVVINGWVAEDIKMYERLGLPAGVYLIDRPWAQGRRGFGNFTWDPQRFPNGDEMVRLLQARGWRVVVWGAPWAIGRRQRDFGPEAERMGCKVSERELDYTNPVCAAWHRDKITEFLLRSGIDGWKLDRGEETNPSDKSFIYHDGRTGFEVHNDYPRMYINTYFEATRKARGDDFVLMPRAAYTGAQAQSVLWGGDHRNTPEALRSAVIMVQRAAFMGYPVWGSDTGGYTPMGRDREVFARWLQFSAFCPLMEIGGVGWHEPWAFPPRFYDRELIEVYREFTRLHDALGDYTYALAERAHRTGNPIVHPLVMDWPDDPRARAIWDEYMYGPALLVAPVWVKDVRAREVYLPEGQWTSLWDHAQQYTGPASITAPAPFERIPVFVRVGREGLLPEGMRP